MLITLSEANKCVIFPILFESLHRQTGMRRRCHYSYATAYRSNYSPTSATSAPEEISNNPVRSTLSHAGSDALGILELRKELNEVHRAGQRSQDMTLVRHTRGWLGIIKTIPSSIFILGTQEVFNSALLLELKGEEARRRRSSPEQSSMGSWLCVDAVKPFDSFVSSLDESNRQSLRDAEDAAGLTSSPHENPLHARLNIPKMKKHFFLVDRPFICRSSLSRLA